MRFTLPEQKSQTRWVPLPLEVEQGILLSLSPFENQQEIRPPLSGERKEDPSFWGDQEKDPLLPGDAKWNPFSFEVEGGIPLSPSPPGEKERDPLPSEVEREILPLSLKVDRQIPLSFFLGVG